MEKKLITITFRADETSKKKLDRIIAELNKGSNLPINLWSQSQVINFCINYVYNDLINPLQ